MSKSKFTAISIHVGGHAEIIKIDNNAVCIDSQSSDHTDIKLADISIGSGKDISVSNNRLDFSDDVHGTCDLVVSPSHQLILSEVRQLISIKLKTESDFDRFCIDHYFSIYHLFGAGMNRLQKENLLIEKNWDTLNALLENLKKNTE